jgi:hypothetical protein
VASHPVPLCVSRAIGPEKLWRTGLPLFSRSGYARFVWGIRAPSPLEGEGWGEGGVFP